MNDLLRKTAHVHTAKLRNYIVSEVDGDFNFGDMTIPADDVEAVKLFADNQRRGNLSVMEISRNGYKLARKYAVDGKWVMIGNDPVEDCKGGF